MTREKKLKYSLPQNIMKIISISFYYTLFLFSIIFESYTIWLGKTILTNEIKYSNLVKMDV